MFKNRKVAPPSYEPMTDEQIEIFANTMSDVPAAIERAPEELQQKIHASQEDLSRARRAGEMLAHEIAKVLIV